MAETVLKEKPGAPIKWVHGAISVCWNTAGYDCHTALHASRVQGIGKPYVPAPPKARLRSQQDVPTFGYAKSFTDLFGDEKRSEFMLSLPDNVRAFFGCFRKTGDMGCYSESLMKGYVISGSKIEVVPGQEIAQLLDKSQKTRLAMQAFRKAGGYVNGWFAPNKETFILRNCNIKNVWLPDGKLKIGVACKDVVYTPDQFPLIKLVCGMDKVGNIVDAVYVVKGTPAVVLRREAVTNLPKGEGARGFVIHKELPPKAVLDALKDEEKMRRQTKVTPMTAAKGGRVVLVEPTLQQTVAHLRL